MTQLSSLYEVLDNTLHVHKALYTLAMEKKDALIQNDVNTLTAITQKEQKLVKIVEASEAQRIEIVQDIFTQKGIALSESSIQALIKTVTGAEDKARLQHYREEFIRIVSELRERNELNQQLLEQSLSFINVMIDVVTDSPEEDFIYKKPTMAASLQKNRSFFNKKI